jgi:undecaprenyl diphosphate synthase
MEKAKSESNAKKLAINQMQVPKHVAIIMDGNGRWAKAKGLPRIAGHKAGMDTVIEIAKSANKLGIEIVTFFTFSTDNWKRPLTEVKFLMDLPTQFLIENLDEIIANNLQIKVVGSLGELPENTLKAIDTATSKTATNTGTILNFALNYGGRTEILDATKKIQQELAANKIRLEDLNESVFSNYLTTAGYPDPELLIRTSGELRLSNFLIWQLAYAELWFTQVFWPDFTPELFETAIVEYQQRSRRFGGI